MGQEGHFWGKENVIPRSLIVQMKGVPASYKRSYMQKLKGYMCDSCGKADLGVDTKVSDHTGYYLYWLETGNQPFDGAVCTRCYVPDESISGGAGGRATRRSGRRKQ